MGVIAASIDSLRPNSTMGKPGVNGPKPVRYCGVVEKLMTLIVRPWKLFLKQMILKLYRRFYVTKILISLF